MDMGCGPGFFTLEMAKLVGTGGRVIAVDLQTQMLARVAKKAARKRLPNGSPATSAGPAASG